MIQKGGSGKRAEAARALLRREAQEKAEAGDLEGIVFLRIFVKSPNTHAMKRILYAAVLMLLLPLCGITLRAQTPEAYCEAFFTEPKTLDIATFKMWVISERFKKGEAQMVIDNKTVIMDGDTLRLQGSMLQLETKKKKNIPAYIVQDTVINGATGYIYISASKEKEKPRVDFYLGIAPPDTAKDAADRFKCMHVSSVLFH